MNIPDGQLPDDLVLVGHVSGAYGVKGSIRVRRYSADADALLHAKTWWLDRPAPHDVDVMQSKMHGDEVVAQLMGVADRDAAEAMKGTAVHVRRSHFPVLADGEFYWIDLIGLEVENLAGERLGTVSDLMDNGAHPILRVQTDTAAEAGVRPEAHERLIPFVEQFVKTVDRPGKKITVDWELDF